MKLDKRTVNFLLSLVQKRPAERPFGETADSLARVHGIGTRRGSKAIYLAVDFNRAASLLRLDGIDPDTPADAWTKGGRTDAALLGGDEKWADGEVSEGLIAVKPALGRTLNVGTTSMLLPPGAHLVIPVDEFAAGCGHSSVVVVENFEPFRRCHRWCAVYLAKCGDDPLFIFRGDKDGGARADAVARFLRSTNAPIVAAFDLDPAGLGMAFALPRIDSVLAPGPEAVDNYLRGAGNTSNGRVDLYQKQYRQWASTLDACTHPEIEPLWKVVRSHGRAIVQERFLESDLLEQSGVIA